MAKKWNLIVDVERCNNCRVASSPSATSTTATISPATPRRSRRRGTSGSDIERKERGTYPIVDAHFVPTMCNHCDDAPCMKAARDGAMKKRDDGIVIIDPVEGEGAEADRRGLPVRRGVVERGAAAAAALDLRCTPAGCGLDPDAPSSAARPTSIAPSSSDSEMQRLQAEESLEVLKPELGTKPRVYYKNLYLVNRCFVGASVVADIQGVEECAAGAQVVLKKDGQEVGRAPPTPSASSRSTGSRRTAVNTASRSGAAGRFSGKFDLGAESRYLGVIRLGAGG